MYPVFEADIIPVVEPVSSVYTFVVPYFGYTANCVAVPSFSSSVSFGYLILIVALPVSDVLLWFLSPATYALTYVVPTAVLDDFVVVQPLQLLLFSLVL